MSVVVAAKLQHDEAVARASANDGNMSPKDRVQDIVKRRLQWYKLSSDSIDVEDSSESTSKPERGRRGRGRGRRGRGRSRGRGRRGRGRGRSRRARASDDTQHPPAAGTGDGRGSGSDDESASRQQQEEKRLFLSPEPGTEAYDSEHITADVLNKLADLGAVLKFRPSEAMFVTRAEILRTHGLLKEARADLDKALDVARGDAVDTLWQRHLLSLQEGSKTDALEELEALLYKAPGCAPAHRARGDVLRALGQEDEAIDSYTEAIRLDPNDISAIYARGVLREEYLDDPQGASADMTAVIEADATSYDAYLRRGSYLLRFGRYESALDDFNMACMLPEATAEAFLLQGRVLGLLDRYEGAAEAYTRAITLSPDCYEAFFRRGLLERDRRPARAIRDLSVAILIDHGASAAAFANRGIAYCHEAKYGPAMADFNSALGLDKTLAPVHVNRGILMLRKGEFASAEAAFTKAIAYEPHYMRAYLCRAECYCYLNYPAAAIRDYGRLIRMDPTDFQYYVYRGSVLLDIGKVGHARNDFRAAALLAPADNANLAYAKAKTKSHMDSETSVRVRSGRDLYADSGHAKAINGNYAGAEADFTRALSMKPNDPQTYFDRGVVRARLEKFADAISDLDTAIELDASIIPAFFQRALCKFALATVAEENVLRLKEPYDGELDVGLGDLKHVVEIAPRNAIAWLHLATIQETCGLLHEAIDSCCAAIRAKPMLVKGYLARGAIKYRLGNGHAALQDFGRAAELDPGSFLAFHNRATILHEHGELALAIANYSMCLKLRPGFDHAARNRGVLYYSLGAFAQATPDVEAAVESEPDSASMRVVLGDCYRATDRLYEAIGAYTGALKLDPHAREALVGRAVAQLAARFHAPELVDAAWLDMQKVLHLYPFDLELYIHAGRVLTELGRYKAAWSMFTVPIEASKAKANSQRSRRGRRGVVERAVAEWPDAHEGRALVSLAKDNHFGALADIEAALTAKPKSASLITNRGLVQQHLGDTRAAARDYTLALTHDPAYCPALFNLGNIHFSTGSWAAAIECYDRIAATESGSREAAVFMNRGIARAKSGDSDGALVDLTSALSLDGVGHSSDALVRQPTLVAESASLAPTILFNRGYLYMTQGNVAAASADYAAACSLAHDPAFMVQRADALASEGDEASALAVINAALALDPEVKLEKEQPEGSTTVHQEALVRRTLAMFRGKVREKRRLLPQRPLHTVLFDETTADFIDDRVSELAEARVMERLSLGVRDARHAGERPTLAGLLAKLRPRDY